MMMKEVCLKVAVVMLLLHALTAVLHDKVLVESFTIEQVQMTVGNNMSRGAAPLTIHCQGQGKDLGAQTIPYHQSFTWIVHIILRKNNSYSCDMGSGGLHGHFDIFDEHRDLGRCNDDVCVWLVQEDGLYLRLGNDFVFQFPWH